MAISTLENKKMLEFLIETSEEHHREIVHALDFVSNRIANQGSKLGYLVYRRTKKDVFEYEQIKPYEALIDENVKKFVIAHYPDLFTEFNGDNKILRKYIEICMEA